MTPETHRPARRSRRAARLAVALGPLLAGCGDQEWGAFRPRGSDAAELNALFWTMVGLGGAVFVFVMWVFVRSMRGRDTHLDEEHRERRARRLVVGGGIVLPVVILVPLTVAMLMVANRLAPRLGDAYEIRVIGHQFWWEVEYPETGMITANEIHIPVDTRVRIILETNDVIHSFWVPQLAGKIDMIPGQTTEVVIEAARPGTYLGQCAEFCGVQHARMRFLVVAQPVEEFEQWLADQTGPAARPATEAAERGQQVFAELGCAACHAVRGTDADGVLGPDLTRLATRSTLGAATVANNRGFLGGWITDPQSMKPGNPMPPIPMTGEQLLDLIEYLEGLE
jgi:cytochrome c oxidase subunit II